MLYMNKVPRRLLLVLLSGELASLEHFSFWGYDLLLFLDTTWPKKLYLIPGETAFCKDLG